MTALALLAIASIPMLPALFSGHFPLTHEETRYEHLAVLFFDALVHGEFYPRWLPTLSGGRGYPTFVFYQPVFFYVAACWQALGVGSVMAVQGACATFCLVGVLGAYNLSRCTLDRASSIAAAALFVLTPLVFVNQYVRGDHSEFAAMLLTPWPLACLMVAERRLRDGRAAFGPLIATAAFAGILIATHPAVALFFLPTLFLLAALRTFHLPKPLRVRWLFELTLVGTVGLALASPYWVEVWRNGRWAMLDRLTADAFDPAEHTVAPWHLLSNAWGFGVSAPHFSGMPIGMSVQLGLPHVLIAMVGICVGWRRPWVMGCAIAYALLALATTTLAQPLWNIRLGPQRMIQFPWRLLSVVAVFQLAVIVVAFVRIGEVRRRFTIAVCLVAASAAYYHAMFQTSPQPFAVIDGQPMNLRWADAQSIVDDGVRSLAARQMTFAGVDEFRPVWATQPLAPRGDAPILSGEGDATIAFDANSSVYRIYARIASPAARSVRIEQFYFPGWRVEVNGVAVPDDALRASVDAAGRMIVPVPAGASTLVAHFDGPVGWHVRTGAAAIALIACIAVLWRSRTRIAADVTPSLPSPKTASAL